MTDFLFGFHSGWRYLVLAAGLAALIMVALGSRGGVLGDRALRLVRLFVTTLDIQLVVGVALLFLRPFYGQLIGHLVMMIAAVATAHLLIVSLKKRPPERRTPALAATGIVICLALIAVGILAIGRPIL